MYRIVDKKSKVEDKPVVFLQHGLMSNSDVWIINKPEKALAFTLVKAGYDVWLGNNRGNSHSLLHISKDVTDPSLYECSFEELAKYDLPKMIDMALQVTKNEELTYIGYDYGAT